MCGATNATVTRPGAGLSRHHLLILLTPCHLPVGEMSAPPCPRELLCQGFLFGQWQSWGKLPGSTSLQGDVEQFALFVVPVVSSQLPRRLLNPLSQGFTFSKHLDGWSSLSLPVRQVTLGDSVILTFTDTSRELLGHGLGARSPGGLFWLKLDSSAHTGEVSSLGPFAYCPGSHHPTGHGSTRSGSKHHHKLFKRL